MHAFLDRDKIAQQAINHQTKLNYEAGFKLRNDRVFVLDAISRNPQAFKYASPHLQKDKNILLTANKKLAELKANKKEPINPVKPVNCVDVGVFLSAFYIGFDIIKPVLCFVLLAVLLIIGIKRGINNINYASQSVDASELQTHRVA